MYVTRALFTETGTYNDMFTRPYVSQVDGNTLQQVQQSTEQGHNLTVAAFAATGSTLIRPRTMVESPVGIANGWDNHKLRFMIEVEFPAMGTTQVTEILTGFTDYVGINRHTGSIDPNMVLFVNNVINVHSTMRPVNNRMVNDVVVRDSSQVMTGGYNASPMAGQTNPLFMTPQDLLEGIGLNSTMGGLQDGRDLRVIDSRMTALGGPRLSRRRNNNSAFYLSTVFGAYLNALNSASQTSDNMDSVVKTAKTSVKEREASSDPALGTLMKQSDFTHTGCVSWHELKPFNPNLDNITQVAFNSGGVTLTPITPGLPGEPEYAAVRGRYEYWESTTQETIAAQIISNIVPAIMSDMLLTKLSFTATNDVLYPINGEIYDVTVRHARSFSTQIEKDSEFFRRHIDVFCFRLRTELMTGLTMNNHIGITIGVHADLIGDTFIDISFNGGPVVQYCVPTFCDALFPPVVTTVQDNRTRMAADINNIMNNLNVAHY